MTRGAARDFAHHSRLLDHGDGAVRTLGRADAAALAGREVDIEPARLLHDALCRAVHPAHRAFDAFLAIHHRARIAPVARQHRVELPSPMELRSSGIVEASNISCDCRCMRHLPGQLMHGRLGIAARHGEAVLLRAGVAEFGRQQRALHASSDTRPVVRANAASMTVLVIGRRKTSSAMPTASHSPARASVAGSSSSLAGLGGLHQRAAIRHAGEDVDRTRHRRIDADRRHGLTQIPVKKSVRAFASLLYKSQRRGVARTLV